MLNLRDKRAELDRSNKVLSAITEEVIALSASITDEVCFNKQLLYLDRYDSLLQELQLSSYKAMVDMVVPTSRQLQAYKLKGEVDRYRKFNLKPVNYSSSAFLSACPHCQTRLLVDPAIIEDLEDDQDPSSNTFSSSPSFRGGRGGGEGDMFCCGHQEDAHNIRRRLTRWPTENGELAEVSNRGCTTSSGKVTRPRLQLSKDVSVVATTDTDNLTTTNVAKLIELRKLLPDKYVSIKQLLLTKCGLLSSQEPGINLLQVRSYRLTSKEQTRLTSEVADLTTELADLQSSFQVDYQSYSEMTEQQLQQQTTLQKQLSSLQ